MWGHWLQALIWMKNRLPAWAIKKKRFNFITLHYIYILGMIIFTSILLYPAGGLHYIDALFLASGAVTQSGLNTVNINSLYLYQQIILYLIPFFATPIYIHGFVVFVRLYWFERRFQNVVQNSDQWRRTRSQARTPTQDNNHDKAERGVAGRPITVLRNTGFSKSNTAPDDEKGPQDRSDSISPSTSSKEDSVPKDLHEDQPPIFRRDITFADELQPSRTRKNSDDEFIRLPQRISTDQHIAFLENQRNPKDKVLRIPSPWEFDRGGMPVSVEDEGAALARQRSRTTSVRTQNTQNTQTDGKDEDNCELNGDDHHLRRGITIEEPISPRQKPRPSTNPNPGINRSATEDTVDHARHSRLRSQTRRLSNTFSNLRPSMSQNREKELAPYLSYQPTIGRNSMFVDLTEDQREELGGIEYRSLKTLAIVLVAYYVGFHIFAVIFLVPWIVHSSTWGPLVESDGVTRTWWGFFTAASAFGDVGFTLTPDSMMSFRQATLPLLVMSFLIVIGNTGFPCMLRLVIWMTSKVVTRGSGIWEELMFLLDHPRRCFTLLFPRHATWWLFWILVIMNGLDLIFFFLLDLNDPTVTGIPAGYRFLNGLFQAFCTRTAGFSSVNLADLHPGIQVSYLIMMYISAYPIAISIRQTNVYEEKSLGIYDSAEDPEDPEDPDSKEGEGQRSYMGAHLRRQLGFDLWFVFLGLFIISIVEGTRLEAANDFYFSLFSVLFEIVSAYGTVGLSLGYPGTDPSFSAQLHTISKLVIIAMQIRGRHRGLPYDLDRAVLLPSENLQKSEALDAAKRMRRRSSVVTTADADISGGRRADVATSTALEGNTGGSIVKKGPIKKGVGYAMTGLAHMMRPGESR
ncbi:MAG: low affinity potassium transporter [Cirrosporium novae-zelandiae]|nr:MAG: low affinity potassium transporter [Cirrosporium novae-zelandiae]